MKKGQRKPLKRVDKEAPDEMGIVTHRFGLHEARSIAPGSFADIVRQHFSEGRYRPLKPAPLGTEFEAKARGVLKAIGFEPTPGAIRDTRPGLAPALGDASLTAYEQGKIAAPSLPLFSIEGLAALAALRDSSAEARRLVLDMRGGTLDQKATAIELLESIAARAFDLGQAAGSLRLAEEWERPALSGLRQSEAGRMRKGKGLAQKFAPLLSKWAQEIKRQSPRASQLTVATRVVKRAKSELPELKDGGKKLSKWTVDKLIAQARKQKPR